MTSEPRLPLSGRVPVSPPTPVPGGTITLTVRFWNDAHHRTPSDSPDVRSLDRFLQIRRVDVPAKRIPVDVERVRLGVYRGNDVISGPVGGVPVVVLWEEPGLAGYADPVEIVVASTPPPRTRVGAGEAPTDGPTASWDASSWMLAILVAAISAGWLLSIAARKRSPTVG